MVELGPCQGLSCSAVVRAPEYIKVRALCQPCYEAFLDGSSTTLALRDGRTATRTPAKDPKRRPRVTIATFRALLYPVWSPHTDDFQYDVPLFPTVASPASFPPTTTQFAHLDSCAGIGAGGGTYFVGTSRPVHYNVHGVNATADFSLSKSQTCALMFQDTITGEDFLGMYGGMLRADPKLIADLIFSTGQMSDLVYG